MTTTDIAIEEGKLIGRQIVEANFPPQDQPKIRMLRNNLLLEPLPENTKSDGGIHLPGGQTGDLKMYWKVLAVGEGMPNKYGGHDPILEISVGDTVITPLHFSHHTMEDGTGRKIVSADQIIGKFEEDVPVI